jgi:KDO2-lipid IV(A) lauroyltransferase
MLISAHMGNWEWMAPAFHGKGHRVAEVVRPLDHPRMNALVNGTRSAGLDMTIPKEGAGPGMIRMLRDGWLVGVLIDQSPRTNGVPVNFFGAPCWATVAPVMAAVRAHVPVYGVTFTRNPRGHYTLTVRTRIEVTRSADLHKDLVDYSQQCQDFIEAAIREHPEQWLWLHRRWKPRPRLEREWARRLERSAKDTTEQDEPEE